MITELVPLPARAESLTCSKYRAEVVIMVRKPVTFAERLNGRGYLGENSRARQSVPQPGSGGTSSTIRGDGG